jgi:HlyD family secretion protein
MRTVINSILLLVLISTSCGDSGVFREREAPTVQVRIVETGELAAINTRAFVVDRYGRRWNNFKITGLLTHGTPVKAGDSVIQLDPSSIQQYIISRESDLENQLASFEKMLVDQSNRRSELESRMMTETANFELRKLELEASRFESDRIRKIKELEFAQAKIAYERSLRHYELNKLREKNDLKIQEIRLERLKEEIKSAYDILPELTLRSPIDGIFQVARHRRSREMIKVGDEMYHNNVIAHVPDLSQMKVVTSVSELDFLKIQVGQEVDVRLDAMPELVFKGEVAYMGKLSRQKDWNSKQKVFDVEVVILESDERLKPGMTVSCEFYLN